MALDNLPGQRCSVFQKQVLSHAGLAAVCATVSVVCYRAGFFYFLFLLPLAICSFLGNLKTAWAAGLLASALNILVSLWFFIYQGADPLLLQWNALYFTVMVMIFTWINAPIGRFGILREIPYRMVAGAVLCTLLLMPLYIFIIRDNELRLFITSQVEALSSSDLSQEELILTTEKLISTVIFYGLRGGLLLYCLIYWLVNRQFALLICRLIRREPSNQTGTFLNFRVPFFLVWVLSLSLGVILLGKTGNIEIAEICGWNFLVLSATLFFVQGGAIMLHFLMRFPPLPRIIINVGIILLFFKPVVNVVLLGLLVLLGIAENWAPFRSPKQ